MTDDLPRPPLVDTVERDGQVIVTLRGEFDLTNVSAVEQPVAAYAGRPGITRMVFDMTHLAFMDSSVIAVLLKAAAAGKQVSLRNPSELIREVIATTGLEDVLRLE